ncbi:MAG: RpiB/LacA/LacB family sugar-phosphate isomerase [Bacillota bacterium]
MKVGIAADHGGFELKEKLSELLKSSGYTVVDYGAYSLEDQDDYPDFVIPLAKAVAAGQMERGIAVCGSGVGASIVANKIPGARAALVTDIFSAHQGVEDDNMNIICFGGRVSGPSLVWELTQTFLSAHFSGAERHQRRLSKVLSLEKNINIKNE